MAYYNTNKEEGAVLGASKQQNERQEDRILRWFRAHPKAKRTPCEIWGELFGGHIPLTNVRRGMTDLTSEGLLEKTNYMRRGRYGKQVHTWRLAPPPPSGGPVQEDLF